MTTLEALAVLTCYGFFAGAILYTGFLVMKDCIEDHKNAKKRRTD